MFPFRKVHNPSELSPPDFTDEHGVSVTRSFRPKMIAFQDLDDMTSVVL